MVSNQSFSFVKMPDNTSKMFVTPLIPKPSQGPSRTPPPQTNVLLKPIADQINTPVLPQGQAISAFDFDRPESPTLDEIKTGSVIKKGAEGDAVKQLQTLLTQAGYPVQVNGRFGSTTESLLKNFQRDNQIQVNGQLGPTTLKALENPLRETALGRKLATAGQSQALNLGGYNSLGKCYTGVGIALEQVGVHVTGLSAYMAADQLENNPRFREVKVNPSQLPKLPAGSVIVWDRSSNPSLRHQGGGFTHGHISISDGKGREMSDYIDTQRTSYYASNRYRVFLPN